MQHILANLELAASTSTPLQAAGPAQQEDDAQLLLYYCKFQARSVVNIICAMQQGAAARLPQFEALGLYDLLADLVVASGRWLAAAAVQCMRPVTCSPCRHSLPMLPEALACLAFLGAGHVWQQHALLLGSLAPACC